ncbi:PREDICTED: LOW QUALITY PROTEIN [Prunus dulcis]|uniref:PREDICTED: LOW QUALITY PROTEIN n=1 Tax=Prunus dulcis TaxID=3755 RepID=A0A5E4EPC2_PRUDU|nr:PREDICTED: LOW QUALITY PROTEIN [Prunus dulcis]
MVCFGVSLPPPFCCVKALQRAWCLRSRSCGIVKPQLTLTGGGAMRLRSIRRREAAELQWKAMVEDIKHQQKQRKDLGNFKNCLAMCLLTDMLGNHRISALSLGLVVSEMSEEPWKGMVITFGDSSSELLLHSIQGNDLKSKRKFMMQTWQNFRFAVNFPEACDMILEVAVNENLKAEKMIKKVFVFTDFASGCHWKTKYEEVRRKFMEQGYEDDAIPQVLIWGLFDLNMPSIEELHPGLTLLSGFSDNLSKLFSDNGGEIGPHQLMEAAIADKEYQSLREVD